MKRILTIVLACLSTFFCQKATAQRPLTEKEKEVYQQRIQDVVNDFNARVTEIWRRPTETEKRNMERFNAQKEVEINAALNLFIGKGKAYIEERIDSVWNGREYEERVTRHNRRPVSMQTSNVNNEIIGTQTVESYLRKAAKDRGARVKVSACDAYFASGLKEVGPGRYEATVAFVQDFVRYTAEDRRVYADRTTKVIRVILTKEKRGDDEVYVVELGDIRVVETRRL